MINVVINADDFGYSKIFNEKILDLLNRGFIFSTTCLVDDIKPNQREQVRRLVGMMKAGRISVGVHLQIDPENSAFGKQIDRQCMKFRSIFGRKPSHIDLHIPRYRKKAIYARLREIVTAIDTYARGHGIPCRHVCRNEVLRDTFVHKAVTTTAPVFSITGKSYKEVMRYFKGMRDGKSYELLVHAGEYDPHKHTSLNAERLDDYVMAIRLQAVFESRKDVRNISFKGL